MPIALDPRRSVPVTLDSDADLPEGTRPTFRCKFLSCADVLEIEDLIAASVTCKTQKEKNAKLNAVLSIMLTDWINVTDRKGKPIAFDPAKFDPVLSVAEKYELVYGATNRIQIAESELKKSLSQRASEPAPSAKTASEPAAA